MKRVLGDGSFDDDPMIQAAMDLIGSTGATCVSLMPDEDEDPVVWVATAWYPDREPTGVGLSRTTAVLDLCEVIAETGKCVHCGRPVGMAMPDDLFPEMLTDKKCWRRWNANLHKFQADCKLDSLPKD